LKAKIINSSSNCWCEIGAVLYFIIYIINKLCLLYLNNVLLNLLRTCMWSKSLENHKKLQNMKKIK